MPIVVSFSADASVGSGIPGRRLTRPVKHADLISILKDIERELEGEAAASDTGVDQRIRDDSESAQPQAEDAMAAPASEAASTSVESDAEGTRVETDTESTHVESDAEITRVEKDVAAVAGESKPAVQSAESYIDKARPARRFVEDTRYIGLIRRVLRRGRPAEIVHPTFPTVRIFPQLHAYTATNEPTSIPAMFRESAMKFAVNELAADVAAGLFSTHSCRPVSRLLYCAALFGCEGRLLLNCNTSDKLRLVDWPDFDALPHLPEHRRLAKYLLENDADLKQVVSSTGVKPEIVIGFCNACEASGLIRRTPVLHDAPGLSRQQDERDVTPLLDRVRGLFKP